MAIINFNSISGINTISVASSITVGNNVAIGTDTVTATTFSGNATGLSGTPNVTVGTIGATSLNASGIVTASSFSGSGANLTGVVPTAITVANEATDTTCFPLFSTAATGNLGPKSNTGLTYNSSTNALSATTVSATTGIAVGGATAGSGGVAFPATAVSVADANTLDDYEEGSWTPTDGSGAGLSLTVTAANYTKIGRQVIAWFWINYPSTANGNNAKISGLPFAVGADPIIGGAFTGYTSYTKTITGYAVYTTTSVTLTVDGGSFPTNANLSGKDIRMQVLYTV